jgi:hypothetical protein
MYIVWSGQKPTAICLGGSIKVERMRVDTRDAENGFGDRVWMQQDLSRRFKEISKVESPRAVPTKSQIEWSKNAYPADFVVRGGDQAIEAVTGPSYAMHGNLGVTCTLGLSVCFNMKRCTE